MALDLTTAPASLNVTIASAQTATALTAGQWVASSTTACWITLGATAVAHAASAIFVPASFPVAFNVPVGGSKVAGIRDAADGWVSFTANV